MVLGRGGLRDGIPKMSETIENLKVFAWVDPAALKIARGLRICELVLAGLSLVTLGWESFW